MAPRMVQCPVCRTTLHEPPGQPYFQCGKCSTVLQSSQAAAMYAATPSFNYSQSPSFNYGPSPSFNNTQPPPQQENSRPATAPLPSPHNTLAKTASAPLPANQLSSMSLRETPPSTAPSPQGGGHTNGPRGGPATPKYVQCQHCASFMTLPAGLPMDSEGNQLVRCGKCQGVNKIPKPTTPETPPPSTPPDPPLPRTQAPSPPQQPTPPPLPSQQQPTPPPLSGQRRPSDIRENVPIPIPENEQQPNTPPSASPYSQQAPPGAATRPRSSGSSQHSNPTSPRLEPPGSLQPPPPPPVVESHQSFPPMNPAAGGGGYQQPRTSFSGPQGAYHQPPAQYPPEQGQLGPMGMQYGQPGHPPTPAGAPHESGGGGKAGIKTFIKRIFKPEEYERDVTVNGKPIVDEKVKKAEARAGPIKPGNYWYDVRAGFWGVMGGPCLGIIPAGISELAEQAPLARDVSGGDSGVVINGRELQQRDLAVLANRGLPKVPASYWLDIDGHLLDAATGQLVRELGKLAPSLEVPPRRGVGMLTPPLTAEEARKKRLEMLKEAMDKQAPSTARTSA